ncbi:MAG: ATP-binding protein [Myxococcota bacterium]
MQRKIQVELSDWKTKPNRMPLLLRGARQVGKTFIVEELGRKYFESSITINFELEPKNIKAFESLHPEEIIARLDLINRTRIVPGKTLLFLDEIQQCPQAIVALRYFKEKMPELHVIGAGSLLEFVLHQESFSFPVGRIQPIYLKPMSFEEFLLNTGESQSLEFIKEATLNKPPDQFLHEHLLQLVRRYFLLGGMPAVLNTYTQENSWLECARIQSGLLQTYRSDFGKYSTKAQHIHLEKLFEKAPGTVGEQVKYTSIDPDTRSREIKTAIQQLEWSGLLTKIRATAASGMPLEAQVKENLFKLLFLDIGLLQNANQINPSAIFEQDLLQINQGALAEQFVGQELLAYTDCYQDSKLYFWQREEKSSQAEVDYVINLDANVIPIEVKAGKTGRLKSLRQFMDAKKSPFGIKISTDGLAFEKDIISLPFYLIGQLQRICRQI